MAEIRQVVAEEFGVDTQELRTHGRHAGVAKKVALELCCQFCGKSQRRVGEYFGYTGNGAVGKQRARLREMAGADRALSRRMKTLQKMMGSG